MRKPFVPFLLLLAILACNFPTTTMGGATAAPVFASPESTPLGAAAPAPTLPPTRDPNLPVVSPTPDSAHSLPTLRGDYIEYRVQPYDFLSSIAVQFGVTLEELIAANDLPDPNQLEVGQVLLIPPQSPADSGPDFKIVPDSEMVNGPYALFFDVAAFVDAQPGYLKQHREEVDQRSLSGAQIVQRVASEYSVNPKLLLAVLEYQSGWLSDPNPRTSTLEFAMGVTDSWRTGLYRQLSWAADNLNKGYYDWKSGATSGWKLTDASFVPAAATINPGTAGVQYLFSLLYPENEWRHTVSENGVFETYNRLFGYPFDVALHPVHALVAAQHVAADGLIARADNGAVVQDLDADGYEQTGWTILYMHVGAEGRVQAGQTVQAGERIGHPSCEGGLASATHLHLARRYNGEWIPASGVLAFVLDGWVSTSDGVLYDGALQREGISVEACECRDPANMLQR